MSHVADPKIPEKNGVFRQSAAHAQRAEPPDATADPSVALIVNGVDRWLDLPAPIRVGLMAMIQAILSCETGIALTRWQTDERRG